MRRPVKIPSVQVYEVGDLDASTDCSTALSDQQIVIHAAARAHIMKDEVNNPLGEYSRVNVDGTLNLARQAAKSGVRRFIFISSIGANGVFSPAPFKESDKPNPTEDYAISKMRAEAGLKKIANQTNMDVVIIRPPLVYGPNAPGNFGKLSNLVKKRIPLPFGAINGKRSLVALDNLLDLIVTCIDHPRAANKTFLVSDDQDVSTTELLRLMAQANGKKSMLLPIPLSWLQLLGKMLGKQPEIDRLCGTLQVDISYTKDTLNWKPPISLEEGIRRSLIENN